MKKIMNLLAISLLAVLAVFFMVSCGSGGGSSGGGSGTNVVCLSGVITNNVSSRSIRIMSWPPGWQVSNPNYPIVITTPESYAVGIWLTRFAIGTAEGATAYYIIGSATDTYAQITAEAPLHYSMTATPTVLAQSTNYPAAGTYNVFIPTIAYLQQTLPSSLIDFHGATTFRVIMSNYTYDGAAYIKGDVKVLDPDDNTWKWINRATGSLDAVRPASPYTVNWEDASDPFEATNVTFNSITIPDNPNWIYDFTLVFDVGSTFAFNDINENGIFEPTIDLNGGTREAIYGSPEFNIGPPNLAVTVSTSEL
jgi:hypothetical protein